MHGIIEEAQRVVHKSSVYSAFSLNWGMCFNMYNMFPLGYVDNFGLSHSVSMYSRSNDMAMQKCSLDL